MLLFLIICVLVLSVRVFTGNMKKWTFISSLLFCTYIAAVINIAFFPFPFQKELIELAIHDQLGSSHNLVPFHDLTVAIMNSAPLIASMQLVKNALLFLPLGFFIAMLFPKQSYKQIIFSGFASSLLIEVTQWSIGAFIGYYYRTFDVDDLMMNTVGTAIGLFIFVTIRRILLKKNRFRSHNTLGRI